MKLENVPNNSIRGDIENPANNSQAPIWSSFQHFRGGNFLSPVCGAVRQKLHRALWDLIDSLVPQVKHIRQMKFMHGEALRLVQLLCTEAERLDPQKAANIFADPLFQAVSHGIPEIIENILVSFPIAVQFRDNEGRNIIERAVLYRRHNVFNLIYRMNRQTKHALAEDLDRFQTNILHLAGILAPQDQLNLVSSAALQMQRELQWFKEVEKLVPSIYRDARNYEGKTPRMVFTDKHKELVKEGEKWMKDTANSCSVVAALIATVVFAAAITVPGGTNGDSGFPVFSSEKAFVIFAVSDALSLFSSTAAILMFLSILTARYAGDNFLQALPKRLIMGLLSLFISITTMMIAFSATLYLVFGNDETWILTSVAASACLLVILFVYLQFSLLVDMFSSIYGHGIFGQHAQRIRHLSQYIPLYKAALKGDRESARRIFDSNPNAIAARITEGLSTAVHIAVGTGKNIDFVCNLIDLKPVEALELTNDSNSTSLTVATMVGNLEVARLLVERNPNLPYIRDNNEVVPLHRAVQYGHKNLVSFLLGVTRNEIEPTYPSPYAGSEITYFGTGWITIWSHASTSFGVPINMENLPNHPIEGDYPADCSQVCVQICSRFSTARGNHLMFGWQKLPAMAWEVIEILELDFSEATELLKLPLLLPASCGIPEVIEEISASMPPAL
ncbi:protein of unknown function DUF3447 - like 10 [Theobroma cacao]|nr:protein of unknown function DUF3447 - like 10 [Theobroma cacao]